MDNERHYFLVGIFVIGVAAALFAFTFWLTARDDSQYQEFRIRFAESVSGLSAGSDVKFRGVKVGTVKEIEIDPQDSRLIRVEILLLKTTPVKVDTKANLKMQGITGTVFIELSGGDPSKPDLVEGIEKDTIPIIPAEQSSLNALIDRVPILLDKISNSVDRFNKLVSDENLAAAHHMMQNGDAAVGSLRSAIEGSQQDIQSSGRSAASAMQHLDQAAGRFDSMSERIEGDPASLLFPPSENGIPAP